jgi:capsular exopolysaccharide synthesis family protein
MSELLKALDQAEREQALRRRAATEGRRRWAGTSYAANRVTAPPELPSPGGTTSIDPHLVSLTAPMSPAAEQYRALRHVLEQARQDTGLQVVAVSAPAMGDGKTTTAINLAGALAQSPDTRVLLVDLDLRRPAIGDRLGLAPDGRGIHQALLASDLTLADVVQPLPPFNLTVLNAGASAVAPYELLKSPRLGELMSDARKKYDWVVLDTPPLIPISDCRLISRCVDAFIVVVTVHRTRRRMLTEALGVLDASTVLGLVLNGDDDPRYGSYYTGYLVEPKRRRWPETPSWRQPVDRVRALWERWGQRGAGGV